MEELAPARRVRGPAAGNDRVERCFEVCWLMSCEEYGIDPENPPPMRKDVVRKSWSRREPGA